MKSWQAEEESKFTDVSKGKLTYVGGAKPILTIYKASNDTSVLYFEDEEDAQKYAGSAGVCAGINVCPVSLIQKYNDDLKPLDGITSKDLKWEFQPKVNEKTARELAVEWLDDNVTGFDARYCEYWGSEMDNLEKVILSFSNSYSVEDINLFRQWFDSVQDTNNAYLNAKDYILAKKLYEALGMRVPNSILNKIERVEL